MKLQYSVPVFVLLMGSDVILTLLALEHGWASEGNPLGRFYYEVGAWFMVAVKLLAVGFIMATCWILRNYRPARAWVNCANIVMVAVCVHNLFTLLPVIMGGGD